MCLHWLKRHEQAGEYFQRAQQLDPNGYFIAAHLGWHQFQLENYPMAKQLLLRSLELTPYPYPNTIAHSYLAIIEQRKIQPPSAVRAIPTVPK